MLYLYHIKQQQKHKAMKNLRSEIRLVVAGWPNSQISAGLYVNSIGIKYVNVLNTWEGGNNFKMTLDEFYHCYILRDKEIDENSYIY